MQIICTSLQIDNHASTSSLNFYRPDTLPETQPTASKHWRQYLREEENSKLSSQWQTSWDWRTRGWCQVSDRRHEIDVHVTDVPQLQWRVREFTRGHITRALRAARFSSDLEHNVRIVSVLNLAFTNHPLLHRSVRIKRIYHQITSYKQTCSHSNFSGNTNSHSRNLSVWRGHKMSTVDNVLQWLAKQI